MSHQTQFWETLFGGGGHCGEKRKHKKKRTHRKKKDSSDTCEEIKFYEKLRVPVKIKIMKPKCINDCSHSSTDSTCEEECFESRIKIPVRARSRNPNALVNGVIELLSQKTKKKKKMT